MTALSLEDRVGRIIGYLGCDMKLTNKDTFHSQGISIPTPSGTFSIIQGNGITIQPTGDSAIISAPQPANLVVNGQTPWQLPSLSDAKAPNGTMYFSTTANKAVFKDSSGTVFALY